MWNVRSNSSSSTQNGRPVPSGANASFWRNRGTRWIRERTCSISSSPLGGVPSKIIRAPMCMCAASVSLARKEASIVPSRSMCCWATGQTYANRGGRSLPVPFTYGSGHADRPEKGPARCPARLLRGGRPCRSDRRARARAARAAGLRPQGDRPQQARRRAAHRSAARSSSRRRPRSPRASWSSSAPTASRRRFTRTPRARNLRTIDATCPLVTKVHVEARRFAEQGYTIILIGHDGHEEVEGTTGEAPDSIILVETAEDVDAARVRRSRPGRLHHPDDALGRRDDRRSSPACERVPQRSRARSPTTSVTRRRTASSPSSSSPANATWSS